ncbi:glycosyltransferase [Paenibacillus solisilvae]|uniref:Glycosyltransferase n=1 Tax=Paenibacillus solisilvae TaxID=2486751 RepID=A0ABW0WBA2_9BACL
MSIKKKRKSPKKIKTRRIRKKKTMPRRKRKKKVQSRKRLLRKKRKPRLRPDNPAERRRLHILFIVHSFYPETYTGTEKFVFNMARSMLSRGHRVKVVTYSNAALESYPQVFGEVVYREYEYEGVPVLAYRHTFINVDQTFEIGNKDLTLFAEEVINKEKPDLLHIGHPMRGMEFIQTSLLLGIKYIITLTDFWFICPKSTLLQTNQALCSGPAMGENCRIHCQLDHVHQRLHTYIPLLKSASRILSPSLSLANLFRSSLPGLHVEVLNHGMNYDTIRINEKGYQPGDSLTLFYGGSLNSHKGVHLILEAMSMISTDRLQLKIYGSGPADYTDLLNQGALLDSRITLCGLYSEHDIPHIYQNVDVAVVPSIWYENYPLTLHEALASQVPALVSNIGGMAEKVIDGFNGFTFRVGDARHLAERITQLLDNPSILNGFKANLKQLHIPTTEQEADAYENIYYQ